MRLGRLPHVAEAVARAPKLAARMPPSAPPPRLDRSHIAFAPGLFGNDTLPDCTAAAIANAGVGFAAACGNGLAIEQDQVSGFYARCVGVPVSDIASTDGAILLDVMGQQCSAPILDASGQQRLTGAFGTIHPDNHPLLATACALIGPVILGVDLTTAEQQASPVWDAPSSDEWGGHALILWDYAGLADTDTVRLATWGAFQSATWRWLRAQLREAYALAFPDLLPATGRSFSGLDLDGLRADVLSWCGA